jgi:hypothetical protein
LRIGKVVSHLGFELELAILPLEKLRPHEETIPAAVSILREELLHDEVQFDPVIVDSNTMTILDGMHRHRALIEISAKSCLVCAVDYTDKRVKVSRWLRSVSLQEQSVESLSRQLHLTLERKRDEAIEMVDLRKCSAALLWGEKAYLFPDQGGLFQSFKIVKSFDSLCSALKLEVSLEPDDKPDLHEVRRAILYVPMPTKADVVHAALTSTFFPPKSTRHAIPARPLGIGVPLEILRRQPSDDTIDMVSELERILGKTTPRRLGPGAIYKGRKYEETIYLYEP